MKVIRKKEYDSDDFFNNISLGVTTFHLRAWDPQVAFYTKVKQPARVSSRGMY